VKTQAELFCSALFLALLRPKKVENEEKGEIFVNARPFSPSIIVDVQGCSTLWLCTAVDLY
jgi:hypothetical protein